MRDGDARQSRRRLFCFFQVFLKSERVSKVVQAGGFSAHDFREVFRCNVEKRIRSLPEIEGLSKEASAFFLLIVASTRGEFCRRFSRLG